MSNINIGIDARTFEYPGSVSRGIGHYSKYHLSKVIDMLPHVNFTLYYEPRSSLQGLDFLFEMPNVVSLHVDDYDSDKINLMHICDPMNDSSGFDSPFRVFKHDNMTVTFYDLIPYHYYFSKWQESTVKTYLSRIDQMIRNNCHILAISEYTKNDLCTCFAIDKSRVNAIMAGINKSLVNEANEVDDQAILKKYGIYKPFYLHVGAHDDHKNFIDAFKAFIQLKKSNKDVQFVVSGNMSGHLKSNFYSISEYNFPDIIFTGYTERSELEALYRSATATLFLSSFEGFGFPVIEAMNSGCPVITTNVTSIPEVAGDAAILCDVHDINAVSDAMITLLENSDVAARLKKAGYERAGVFSWETTAIKTIRVWERMLGVPLLIHPNGV